jgi:hypothetical protein
MKRFSKSMLLAALFAVSVGAAPVLAQNAQARHGFWFSGGLGYGSLGCEGCAGRSGSWSGGLSLGGTLSPKFLLGVGTAAWTKSELGGSFTVGTLDARVRFYPSAGGGFFLTGGAGVGSVTAGFNFGNATITETGVSMLIGIGMDLRVGSNVSVTPFWNGFGVRTSNGNSNVGQLGVGITVH